MLKNIIFILTIILTSCYSGLKISKKERLVLNKNFNATVGNSASIIKSKNVKHQTLLEAFHIQEILALNKKIATDVDSVKIYFKDSTLNLYYEANEHIGSHSFKGYFTEKGFFEINTFNDKINIPPILPILYSSHYIDRIRVGLTKNGEIWVNTFFDNTKNIFFLVGGGISNQTYYFNYKNAL